MSETVFSYKTRGTSSPEGKAKVYFTCHPDDFNECFEKISDDILEAFDCTIYYTQDMTAKTDDENTLVDLERMSLFVIPVTLNLLIKPNRAMDHDYLFAREKHIPVLPILLDNGIREVYSRPDRFGEIQYLSPSNADKTKISYKEKLKKYLGSVLESNELRDRIRKAFDAYIFLSYRKTDRKLANDLMKMIHNNPECEDIAIWFDEFLTPGESFRDGIGRMLKDSKLFTLLVTPHLLDRQSDGTPNYIMAQEYPEAVRLEKNIFPAEMMVTDYAQLIEAYPGLPDCTDTGDANTFNERLLDMLVGIAVSENNNDPEHNYLIGLAYLEGIDVEIDIGRGVKLLTKAAEAGLIEAMKKLMTMYREGKKVEADYRKTLYWAKKIYDLRLETSGEEDPDTVSALIDLSEAYRNNGDYQQALDCGQIGYGLSRKVYGDEHDESIRALNDWAIACGRAGRYNEALELNQMDYDLACKAEGEDSERALKLMHNLSNAFDNVGEYEKSFEMRKKCYEKFLAKYGEKDARTLLVLNGLAGAYVIQSGYATALELIKKCYELYVEVLGEKHPDTLRSMENLASAYSFVSEFDKAITIGKKCYELCCDVLGSEHPMTLHVLNNIGRYQYKYKKYKEALEINKQCYKSRCAVLGENHPKTLTTLEYLAQTYEATGDYQDALKSYADCLAGWREAHNEDGKSIKRIEDKLRELINRFKSEVVKYFNNRDFEKAYPLIDALVYACSKMYGVDAQETVHMIAWFDKAGREIENAKKEQMEREKKMTEKTRGRYDYSNGTYYEGELVGGKPHGHGTYYFKGGYWVGEFKDGCYNGRGTAYYDKKASLRDLVYDNREYEMRETKSGVWIMNKEEGRFVHSQLGVPYDLEFKNGEHVKSGLYFDLPVNELHPTFDSIKCCYGGQSGFIIETVNETFVFDWYRSSIPQLDPNKPVYIFISHVHLDHYNARIFDLAERYNVAEIYLGLSGKAIEQAALEKMPASVADILCSFRGDQRLETDFGSVRSITSTDLGVAFIVETKDFRFFHAGDLFVSASQTFTTFKNRLADRFNKMLKTGYSTGLTAEQMAHKFYLKEVRNTEEQFKANTRILSGIGTIDYAMLPLDPRWYDFGFRTIDHYLSVADIKWFTPMHLWEKYDYVTDYVKHNPDAANKIIAVNPDGCNIFKSIVLNETYYVDLR